MCKQLGNQIDQPKKAEGSHQAVHSKIFVHQSPLACNLLCQSPCPRTENRCLNTTSAHFFHDTVTVYAYLNYKSYSCKICKYHDSLKKPIAQGKVQFTNNQPAFQRRASLLCVSFIAKHLRCIHKGTR